MKRFKVILLAVFAIGLFGISSCDKFENPVGDDSNGLIDSTIFNITQYDISEFEMSDANLDDNIEFAPILERGKSTMDDTKGDKSKDRYKGKQKRIVTPFDFIFRKMNLDSTQLVAIKGFFKENRDCVGSWLSKLRDSQMQILENANEQIKAIRDSYKAGDITRKDAFDAIMKINKETRKALLNNPVNKEVQDGLKDCNEELIAKIKSILTADQLAIFEKWISRIR